MKRHRYALGAPTLVLLAACASVPEGPTVLVLKGGTKTFQQFAQDDTVCRRFAALEARGTPPDQAAMVSGLAPTQPTGARVDLPPSGTPAHQPLYDIAYAQCMDDKGHRVPLPTSDPPPAVSVLPLPPIPSVETAEVPLDRKDRR